MGTPASSATKTGRHDIAEILLKVALNTINQIKSKIGHGHLCLKEDNLSLHTPRQKWIFKNIFLDIYRSQA